MRVRLLVHVLRDLEREEIKIKISRTHVQTIVHVFGGIEMGEGGQTYLKKGSLATLFSVLPALLLVGPCRVWSVCGEVRARSGVRWSGRVGEG